MERPEKTVLGTLTAEMPAFTAERLVEEAQAYSQDAWAHIYDRHYPKMVQYCYLRTGNRAGSEDLASEVFLEALKGIRGYQYRGVPLSAWLYRIARNLTADFVRRNARKPTVPLGEEPDHSQLQTPDAADSSALRHDMRAAILQLTEDQQQVIILRFFQGLTHEETAAIMGRRGGAVRVLQNRALSALRRLVAA